MVVWCENCQRFVNQHCDTCGENFGVLKCEKYACGGTMICPICGGSNLVAKKKTGPDQYEYYKDEIQRPKQPQQKQKQQKQQQPRAAPPQKKQAPPPAPSTQEARAPKPSHSPPERDMKCPLCGFPVESTWKYCPECGVSFKLKR